MRTRRKGNPAHRPRDAGAVGSLQSRSQSQGTEQQVSQAGEQIKKVCRDTQDQSTFRGEPPHLQSINDQSGISQTSKCKYCITSLKHEAQCYRGLHSLGGGWEGRVSYGDLSDHS